MAKADDSTICTCPESCSNTRKSVCGPDDITYKNECEMRARMCKEGKAGKLKHLGACGGSNVFWKIFSDYLQIYTRWCGRL